MGVVSEILPVFSRKPLFGYQVMVFSGIAIGFMGWGVWAHHMFATGLGPVALSAFSASTMFIAVPTGVKIFNWISTLWKGKIRLTTPLLFAVGFVTMFTIGGLSGVTHAVVPSDTQQTDTYYIVAHFHYVLFGGSIFGLFGGLYYWYPLLTGRMLSDRIGKVHFALTLIGFNATFAPFHILGLQGMPRRIYTYPSGRGWDVWNFVATLGSYCIALSVLVFLYNLWVSRKSAPVGPDPWDARTLEWTIPNPPPEYNFKEIPLVTARDDFWHRKYTEDEDGRAVRRERVLPASGKTPPEQEVGHDVVEDTAGDTPAPSGGIPADDVPPADTAEGTDLVDHVDSDGDGAHEEHEEHVHIHLPSPSYWPAFSAVGLAIISYGMIYKFWIVAVLGAVWLLAGIYSWSLEPATAPDEPEEPNGNGATLAPDDEPSADLQPVGQA